MIQARLLMVCVGILSFLTGFSQKQLQINESVIWQDPYKKNIEGNLYESIVHPSKGYWNDVEGIPMFVKYYNTTSQNCEFILTSSVYSPISQSEGQLISQHYNDDRTLIGDMVSSRGDHYMVVNGPAVRMNNSTGQLEKLVEFSGYIIEHGAIQKSLKSFANSSVLESGSGSWYKIGVTEQGVQKVDYALLEAMGAVNGSVASDALNIFGNGFGTLPEPNSEYRTDDLDKLAIKIEDGGDGTFDDGDFILFYGNAADVWVFEDSVFDRKHNYYCDTSYYFVNLNQDFMSPKRIGTTSQSSQSATHNVVTFTDLQYHEYDRENLLKSGRQWYGELFDVQTNYNFSFSTPNLVSSEETEVRVNFVGKATSTGTSFTSTVNGVAQTYNINGAGSGTYAPAGVFSYGVLNQGFSGNTLNVSINYSKGSGGSVQSSAKGWLDFIEVLSKRQLTMSGGQLTFRNPGVIGVGNVANYTISNASGVSEVWEITDHDNVSAVNVSLGSAVSFTMNADSLREFVALTGSGYNTPAAFGQVSNQNLHGMSPSDLIIICVSDYLPAANELAAFHQSEGTTVQIVTPEQVYNEFSSGMRDPTAIRSFLRMFFKKANGDPALMPKYCLLFGDATYDSKNILDHNLNFIPTYESSESLSVTSTYATDDYFGILSDVGNMKPYDLMDIAIGRLPVESVESANEMVEKVKAYSTGGTTTNLGCATGQEGCNRLGDWRNLAMLVSDDGDGNAYFQDVELMSSKIDNNNNSINQIIVHTDAYNQISTPGGERNYDAEEIIKKSVNSGALLVNYIGHGGETGWAHERILNVSTIQEWENSCKLPIFMTATCEFSRYDDHDRTSAGEYVVLNPTGGGIGLFTTTRLVYATSNRYLNTYFYDTVFDRVNGQAQNLGDIILGTKNKFAIEYGDPGFRKFALLGDPAVKLAMPLNQVVTDSVNGVALGSGVDTLKALSKITISGHVEDLGGTEMTGFNGVVYPTVFDKELTLSTLGSASGSPVQSFSVRKNVVYKGKASVVNGKFSFTFMVPQDISFNFGTARLSYYIENGSLDGQGHDESLIIGGIDTTAVADNVGPEIELFMNDDSFVNGGITNTSPKLYAEVFDESGINTVGNGIGHHIEAVLDGNSASSIILNDYYESDLDTYQSGKISYPFDNIEVGPHTLELKVWDVHNNSNKAEIEFVVASDEAIALEHVLNYPNPFTTSTEFMFEHNQVCDYLDVQIGIFTVSGKLVKNINQRIHTDGFRVNGLMWDGTDDFGDKIGTGVYVYRVKVQNERGESQEKFEKLVILNSN